MRPLNLIPPEERRGESAPYNEFASLTTTRSQTVSSLAQSRFDWQRVLNELALVIPSDVTLTNLNGAATADQAAGGAAPGDSAAVTGPSLQLSGCAEGQEGVASLLASLRDIDGVTRVGMQSSILNDQADAGAGTAGAATDTTGCEGDPKLANFEITVAFDEVPTTTGTTDATGAVTTTPAPATTDGATPTSSATDDGGASQAQAEQKGAKDSANKQTQKASNAASAVGAGQ